MADIPGGAAAAGAAAVVLLLPIIAPLIRGHINAKMLANISNKELVLHMAEVG